MRIGQVNQENYKDYLKLLGVKNPKSLDIMGNSKKEELRKKHFLLKNKKENSLL